MTGPVASERATNDVERVFRESYGSAVATLVRVFGDIQLAEDAVQDAFSIATERWPREGIPANPPGWIITTARNRAIDVVRRAKRGRDLEREAELPPPEEHEDLGPVSEDQLRLIFTCCHPSLRPEHQVALTLRLLGGLSVEEVARSFLVTEAAMAKRLVRAKYKIKAANIAYRVPREADLPERLRSVLSVLYLIYNTGADKPDRRALREEALRLTRSLVALMPDEPEATGLLALMLLNEARMPARWKDGDLVLLRDQDRTGWDREMIEQGQAIVRACIRRNSPGPYQLQAAIQAVHCSARTYEETDWHQIVTLYDQLYRLMPTSVVALNRAIALGEVDGPETGLEAIEPLVADLDDYFLYHATRGTLLREIGRLEEAKIAFERAAQLAPGEKERRFLRGQMSQERTTG